MQRQSKKLPSLPGGQGYYCEKGPRGDNKRFKLGFDESEALRLKAEVEKVWAGVEKWCRLEAREPGWDDNTKRIGEHVVEGKTRVEVDLRHDVSSHARHVLGDEEFERFTRLGDELKELGIDDKGFDDILRHEQPDDYDAHEQYERLLDMQRCFPMIRLVLKPGPKPADRKLADMVAAKAAKAPEEARARADQFVAAARSLIERHSGGAATVLAVEGTFHEAVKAFIKNVELECRDRNDPTVISTTGDKYIRQAETLMRYHDDFPLADLDAKRMNEMERYWQQRPILKFNTNGKPLPPEEQTEEFAASTAGEQMKRVRAVFDFVSASDDFPGWTKPANYERKQRPIRESDEERAKNGRVETFTLDQLCVIWAAAKDDQFIRDWMLMGLNCAYAEGEIGDLMDDELVLDEKHPHYKRIAGSFILRKRVKRGQVYGEWQLWDETCEVVKRSRRMRPRDHGTKVFFSPRGLPVRGRTKEGRNARQSIPNRWEPFIKRLDVPYLPFKHLRKTSIQMLGDLVVHAAHESLDSRVVAASAGEFKRIHTAHGKMNKNDQHGDVYANNPFDALFFWHRKLREHLQPMFDAGR